MKKRFTLLVIITLLLGQMSNSIIRAQVGINTTDPDSTAVLDLKSNRKGLLVPRLTSSEIKSIVSPAEGLLAYCTDLGIFCYYNGTDWISLPAWGQKIDFNDLAGAKQDVAAKVNSNSNVGIGTETPISKLAVNGNLAVGDNVTAPVSGAYIKGQLKVGAPPDAGDVEKVEVDGNINVQGKIKEGGYDLLPHGAIIMWNGTVPPDGWALCDGNNDTPNLSGRFIMASGARKEITLKSDGSSSLSTTTSTFSLNDSNGFDYVQLSVDQMPSHTHTGSTNSAGSHKHIIRVDNGSGGDAQTDTPDMIQASSGTCASCYYDGWGYTVPAGAHTHALNIDNTGGDQAHGNRPPYYVLAFIMKL